MFFFSVPGNKWYCIDDEKTDKMIPTVKMFIEYLKYRNMDLIEMISKWRSIIQTRYIKKTTYHINYVNFD